MIPLLQKLPYDKCIMRVKRVTMFFRKDNARARRWAKRLEKLIREECPNMLIATDVPDAVIVLGGDGAILEAVRTFRKSSPLIVGFNLGNVGFLASVRRPKDFPDAIRRLARGDVRVVKRMIIRGEVLRAGRMVYATEALNEIALQGILGVLRATVLLEGHPMQHIHGTGVLVASPTGSTGYNLSSHGPIITPDMHSLIVTEILDHNIPTPSLIIAPEKIVEIRLTEVRKLGLFALASSGEPVDAFLASDDMEPFPVKEGDVVRITRAKRMANLAEFEEGYFIKSLQEKFAFR